MIWLTLLIPTFAVLVLCNQYVKSKVVLWEYGLLFGVPAVAIVISYFIAVGSQQVDTKYWNGYVTSATYYQSWQEWDHQTCYRLCNCHQVYSGSGENRTSHQECSQCPYDCSHCDDHAEQWKASDNLGNTWHVTPATFETWAASWGNRVFVELNRHINYHNGFLGGNCGRDGNAFRTTFNGDSSKIIPVVLVKHYANKIQTTFKPVDTTKVMEYELFDYPTYDRFGYNPVLGLNDARVTKSLASWNARLGNTKQVHMLLLVFHNQPIEAAKWQEQYWKGGNKNEFILAMGVGDSLSMIEVAGWERGKETYIQWAKVISWTDQRGLKSKVENTVAGMQFEKDIDYLAIVDTMAVHVNKNFVRKNWHAFDTIRVKPSKKAVIVTAIITLFFTVGISIFVVFNDVNRGK